MESGAVLMPMPGRAIVCRMNDNMNWTGYSMGERIALACQMRRVTIYEVADRAGIERSTVYNIAADRAGRLGPTLRKVQTIAETLGVRLGWLAEGEGDIWRPETTKPAEASSPLPVVPLLPLVPAKPLPQQRKRGG